MDDRYKTFQIVIWGQIVTLETAKMVALVEGVERWLARIRRDNMSNPNATQPLPEIEQEQDQRAVFWEIVRTVATKKSTYCDEQSWILRFECPFCNGETDREEFDRVKHEDSCIVAKARKLAKEE